MKASVVNLKTGVKYDVYIGRPSIFGNPYYAGVHGTRGEVIAKFQIYAMERILHDRKFAEHVKSLHGKVLGCYCKPLDCHGDILVNLAAELSS